MTSTHAKLRPAAYCMTDLRQHAPRKAESGRSVHVGVKYNPHRPDTRRRETTGRDVRRVMAWTLEYRVLHGNVPASYLYDSILLHANKISSCNFYAIHVIKTVVR